MEFLKPSQKGFTIYSKSGCQFCIKVKNLLKQKNFLYNEINCDDYLIDDKDNFLLYIENLIGKSYKMFPIIFYDEKFIGGFTQTEEFINKLLLSFEELF
jgi:glutaredoxin